MKKEKIDLSNIKDDELDKTASFTDLMTRSERRQHKKNKIIEDSSIYEINEDFSKKENDAPKRKRTKVDLEEMINEEKDIDDTKEVPVLIDKNNNSKVISLSTIIILLIINLGCLGYFIYSIFNDVYSTKMLLGSGFLLTLTILFYCFIITEPNKKNKGLIVFNSLFIVLYIVYNYLILSGLYKNIIEIIKKVIP